MRRSYLPFNLNIKTFCDWVWLFKQIVKQVKCQTKPVSFSKGDKIGNMCQYWLHPYNYILSTGTPAAEYTVQGQQISLYLLSPCKPPRQIMKGGRTHTTSEVKETSAKLHETVSEGYLNPLYPPLEVYFFPLFKRTCWKALWGKVVTV